MESDGDGDGAYDDEFEAASESSPRRDSPSPQHSAVSSPSRAASPPAPSRSPPPSLPLPSAPRRSATVDDAASVVVRPPTRARPPPPPRLTTKKPVRSVLDQAPWTFTVRASRVRALRVPVAPPLAAAASSDADGVSGVPALHDLRVFAVIDKQPVQSRGSRWKQEARVAEAARPVVVVAARRAHSPTTKSGGVLQEATWRHDDGELAWVLTMDRFRRLKAYSPRIKLFVFGIGANARADTVHALSEDSPTHHRGSIVSLGWFFLDLRTPDLPDRWFKLQNSPFGGEILVSTTFMQTSRTRAPSPNASRQQPAIAAAARRREHAVSADSEYLRLGDGRDADVFIITVFIRGATKLHNVLRASVTSTEEARRAEQSGVWLSYSLFDVVVQTDVFFNLDRAEFAPIRDSFRVMATKRDVLAFLERQRLLSIYLCTHDRVLANADLMLDELSEQAFFTSPVHAGVDGDVVSVSGTLPFGSATDGGVSASFSIERSDEQIVPEGDDSEKKSAALAPAADIIGGPNRPLLGQSSRTELTVGHVQLRTDALQLYAEKEAIELEVQIGGQAVRCPIRLNAFTADFGLGDCPDLLLELDPASPGASGAALSVTCFSSATDHAIATSSGDDQWTPQEDSGEICLPLYDGGRRLGECVLRFTSSSDHAETNDKNRPMNAPRSIPGVSHTYRVFIRLKALRDFESSRPVVISYTNPFTDHERVETPLISVMRKAETEIPEAYCLFEVHRDEASMKEAMESPVVMDVALALPDGSRQVIGCVIFSLNFLYFSEETFCCAETSCGATFHTEHAASTHRLTIHQELDMTERHGAQPQPTMHILKMCCIYLPVTSASNEARTIAHPNRKVGAVQVEAYFEDAGPMSDAQVRLAEEMRVSQLVHSARRGLHFSKPATETKLIASRSSVNDNVTERPIRREARTDEERADVIAGLSNDKVLAVDRDTGLEELKAKLLAERTAWMHEQKLQQAQWKMRAAELEKARMDELEEEWARREEERSSVLKAAQAEYQSLEHKLRVTLMEVETRERKMALAESGLERDQRMLREDTDLLRKRLQSEQSHSLSLAQKQIDALDKKVAELQTHLKTAETRALQVEEDFAEYRKQQRKVPESKLREEIASLRGQVAELEKAKHSEVRARETAEANVEKMKGQLEKMAKLVQAEKKRNESRVVDDLEKLRLKYIAREERYVLDGDREELRAIKKQLDDLRHLHSTQPPQLNRAFVAEATRQSSPQLELERCSISHWKRGTEAAK